MVRYLPRREGSHVNQHAPPELADSDHRIRMRAIYSLVESGDPKAPEWIRPLVRDREALVRSAALMALGQLRDQEAFDALVACLSAPTSHERCNAIQALVALGDLRMREPLAHAVRAEHVSYVRCDIIKALSTFRGDRMVTDALIAVLTDPDEEVRATAAVALGNMRAASALPALQQMAATDTGDETTINGLWETVSWVAQQAIRMIRYPEQPVDLDWPD
jgi:hypothetical protein